MVYCLLLMFFEFIFGCIWELILFYGIGLILNVLVICVCVFLDCRRGVYVRSLVIVEVLRVWFIRFDGVIVMEDVINFFILDEVFGFRVSYSMDMDSEGEGEYSLVFDNESMFGFIVVGVDGMD